MLEPGLLQFFSEFILLLECFSDKKENTKFEKNKNQQKNLTHSERSMPTLVITKCYCYTIQCFILIFTGYQDNRDAQTTTYCPLCGLYPSLNSGMISKARTMYT